MFIDYDKYNDSVINNYREIKEITDGLIAYYKFDGNYNDSVGSYHLSETDTSFISNSVYLNSDTDALETTNNFITITQDTSVSFAIWVKRDRLNSARDYIFSLGDAGTITQLGGAFATTGGNSNSVHLYTYEGTDLNTTLQIDDTIKYHHIIFMFDASGATKYMRIYVNGNLELEQSHTDTFSISNKKLFIGRRDGDSNRARMSIDDFRIYDRALSAEEVEKLYNSYYFQKSLITNSTDKVLSFKYNPSNNNSGQTKYTIDFPEDTECDILIIGGGGSGGNRDGGGGGAGAVIYATGVNIPIGTYLIKVGNGGAQNSGDYSAGNNGFSSEFLGAIAIGGGGGGHGEDGSSNPNGKDGGSGGGGGYDEPNRTNKGSLIQEKTQANFSSIYGNLYAYLNATGTFNVYANDGGSGNQNNGTQPNDAMGGGGGGLEVVVKMALYQLIMETVVMEYKLI